MKRPLAIPKRGRPKKMPEAGKREFLGLRTTAQLKAALAETARVNGRSISQEAELRLERSFEREDMLPEIFGLSFGHEAGGLLLAAGIVMKTVGSTAAHELSMRNRTAPRNWIDDPYAFDQAMKALIDLIDRARPPGDPATVAIRKEVSDARPVLYAGELARAIDGKNNASWAEGIFGQRNIEAIRSMLGKVVGRLRLDGPGMVSYKGGGDDER